MAFKLIDKFDRFGNTEFAILIKLLIFCRDTSGCSRREETRLPEY